MNHAIPAIRERMLRPTSRLAIDDAYCKENNSTVNEVAAAFGANSLGLAGDSISRAARFGTVAGLLTWGPAMNSRRGFEVPAGCELTIGSDSTEYDWRGPRGLFSTPVPF